MALSKDQIGGIFIGLFSALYLYLIFDIPTLGNQVEQAMTARSMPFVLALLGLVLSTWLVLKPGASTAIKLTTLNWGNGLAFVTLMLIYGASLRVIGFVPATIQFLFIGFALLGERRWLLVLSTAILVTLTFWVLLNWGLGIVIDPWPNFMTFAGHR